MKATTSSIDRQTRMAAVVFADLVGFSKKSVPDQLAAKEALTAILQRLVSPYPRESRVVLDTGDGAAVGFLVSPEYALGLALRLRREIDAAPPETLLHSRDLRLGINLGPLKVVTDVNGHPNLVGEGINSAERIMSFAGPGDTTASRSFQEAVYYLDASFQSLFEPLGTRADKHGREHEVFRLTTSKDAIEAALQSLGTAHGTTVATRGAAARMASAAAASIQAGPARVSRLVTPVRMGIVAGALVLAAAVSWQVWSLRQPTRDAPSAASVEPRPPSPARVEPTPAAPATSVEPPKAAPAPARPESTPVATTTPAAEPPKPAPEPAAASPAPPPAAASSTAERRPVSETSGKRAKAPPAAPRSAMAGSTPPPVARETPQDTAGAEAPRTSQRCSRLLQRAAVGEVLTAAEQRELSSCR
jgi:class 3 adenylate cyclase